MRVLSRTVVRPAAVLVAALLTGVLQAAEDRSASAHRLLEGMVSSMRELDYTGVLVYRQGPEELESLRIVHRGGEDGGRERLYSLDGVAREIIRDGDRVTCILPDSKSVMVDHRQIRNPLSSVLPGAPERISRHYRLQVIDAERIAGREARPVQVQATDPYRYGYRFWVDTATGLMLRADLVHGADTVEQVVFTKVDFPESIPDQWLEPKLSGRDFTWYRADHEDNLPVAFEPRWRLAFVPAGFELRLSERRNMPTSGETPVEHQMYSDGLAAVSVYVSSADSEAMHFEGLSRMGAFSAFGRVVAGHQVVVVGQVPPRAVTRMAESLTWPEQAQ